NATTGAIYLSTLGFNTTGIQLFRSTDNGVTFSAPVNATPGAGAADFHSTVVDNFAGAGNGTVYVAVRDFGAGHEGIYLYKSTDGGATFGGGTLIARPAGGLQRPQRGGRPAGAWAV